MNRSPLRKVALCFLGILLLKLGNAQEVRIHRNYFGVYLFTNYDFDKFSIRITSVGNKIPFNHGYGIFYERQIKSKYYIKGEAYGWEARSESKVTPLNTSIGRIFFKNAVFYCLGAGRNIIDKKIIEIGLNLQLIFRKGYLFTRGTYSDLFGLYDYRDFGIICTNTVQIKILPFLFFNLNSGYVYYLIKYDHSKNHYYQSKDIVSRNSVILNSGLSLSF